MLVRAILMLIVAAPVALADDSASQAEGIAFFEKKIRPVLVDRCYDCHSGDNIESDLAVDSREALLAGGTRGPAIVSGKPKQSLLIIAINHGEILQMPKDKLPNQLINDLSHGR